MSLPGMSNLPGVHQHWHPVERGGELAEARRMLHAATPRELTHGIEPDTAQVANMISKAQVWALIALAEAQAELARAHRAQREAMAAGLAMLEVAKSRM